MVDTSGKPVAGAFVDPDVWKGMYRCLGAYLWTRRRRPVPLGRCATRRTDRQCQPTRLRRRVPAARRPDGARTWFSRSSHVCRLRHGARLPRLESALKNATLEFGAVDPRTGDVSAAGKIHPCWKTVPASSWVEIRVNLPVAADGYKIRIESPGYQTFVLARVSP